MPGGALRPMSVPVGGEEWIYALPVKQALLAAGMAAALIGLLVGCSGNANPVHETASVKHDEAMVAAYAETHGDGSGVGTPAGCVDRVVGEQAMAHSRVAYLELLCSGLSRTPYCASPDQTAFVSAAVATIKLGGAVTALSIDQENDAAYAQWVERRFPGKWQHVEQNGPQYGKLLQSQLQTEWPCR